MLNTSGIYDIIYIVVSGKQVKILYEPVAVMRVYLSFLPCAANRGQAIEEILEKANDKRKVEISGQRKSTLSKTASAG